MNEQLIAVLKERRQQAGQNGKPLAFKGFGEILGVDGTAIFRFFNGTKNLYIETVRVLATYAIKTNDNELLMALAIYALGVGFVPAVDN